MSRRAPQSASTKPSHIPHALFHIPTDSDPWIFASLTFAAALLIRLWFPLTWNEHDAPASAFYVGDTRAFIDFAAHLVAGEVFDNGVPFHPPGWPMVLSWFFRAAGYSPMAGVAANPFAIKCFVAMLSAASVALATIVAARVAGRGAMAAVALLGTFHFGHVVTGTVPNSEALYGLLIGVVILLAIRARGVCGLEPMWGSAVAPRHGSGLTIILLLGALAGFTAVVRAEFLLGCVLLGILLWRWCDSSGARRAIVASYAIGVILALLPSTIANWQSISAFNEKNVARLPGPLPRLAPVTSYGALNFATANHALADGGPNNDLPELQPTTQQERDLLAEGSLNLAARPVYNVYVNGYGIGLRWLVTHPVDALGLFARKAMMTSGVLAHGYFAENVPVGVEGVRRRVDMVDPARRVLWWAHLMLLLSGAWLLHRTGSVAVVLLVPALTLAASALFFFGYVRLGAAYLPVIWVVQATALAALADTLPWPSFVRNRPVVTVFAAVLAGVVIAGVSSSSPHRAALEGPRNSAGQVIADETVLVRRLR
jgi:hypothetical protein